jgi:hypothetical protein
MKRNELFHNGETESSTYEKKRKKGKYEKEKRRNFSGEKRGRESGYLQSAS